MKKFVHFIALCILVWVTPLYGATPKHPILIAYELCHSVDNGTQSRIFHTAPIHGEGIFSTDCNNPTDITGSPFNGFLSGGVSTYYSVDLAAGESVVFSGPSNIVIATDCAGGTTPLAPICNSGGETVIIRVTPINPGTYAISANIYTLTADLTFSESSNVVDDGIVCFGDQFSLLATGNGSSGYSYSWTGPYGPTGSNPILTHNSSAQVGTQTYTVTITDINNCTATSSVDIILADDIGFTINPDDNSLCEGDQLTMDISWSVGSGGSYDFEWTLPDGSTSTDAPPLVIDPVDPSHTGTYTLVATEQSTGCSSSATYSTVTVNALPSVDDITNSDSDDIICHNATFSLSTVTSGTGTIISWDWEGTNGWTGTGNPVNITNTTVSTETVTYSVTVTDNNGCTNTGTHDVTLLEEILFTITSTESSGTAPDDDNLCEGDDLSFDLNFTSGDTGDFSYNWSSTGGYTGTDAPPFTINGVDNTHAGTYNVTVTDNTSGCSSTATYGTIVIHALPTITINHTEMSGIAPNDMNVCEDYDNLQFTVTFNTGNNAGAMYEWELANGSTSTDYPLVINPVTPADAGDYSVTVTDANGCTATSIFQSITVNPLPVANPTTLHACELTLGSGQGEFILTDAELSPDYPTTNQNEISDVDDGASNVTVTYHNSMADAENDVLPLSSPLTRGNGSIWVRVEDTTTGCYEVAEVTLMVESLPTVANTTLKACEDLPPGSGTGSFILTDAEDAPSYPTNQNDGAEIDNGDVRDVTFHPTLLDAQNNTGEIDKNTPFTSPNGTIWARIEDPTTKCYNTAQITLEVILPPAGSITTLRECEDPAGSGMADFTLSDAELAPDFPNTNSNSIADIDNGQTRTVMYYATQADAESDSSPIGDGSYPDNTIIYARIVDDATGCFRVVEVTLDVLEAPNPEILHDGVPDDFTICENDPFNLTLSLTTGLAPYMFNWTLPDGSTNMGSSISVAQADPATHHGVWVVTVTDANGCTGTDDIGITVNPAAMHSTCGDAFDAGGGTAGASVSGNNECGSMSGICGAQGESTVYISYTVPPEGLQTLSANLGGLANGVVMASEGNCGGSIGNCSDEVIIDCPTKGATYYFAVSSSRADAGDFSLSIRAEQPLVTISGHTYVDLDASGTYGGIDSGLTGVPLELVEGCPGNGTVVATTTSADDGSYSFQNVPPGMYTVQVQAGAPGAPMDHPSPADCCITIDPCMPDGPYECDLGWPPPDCSSNPYSVDNICDQAYNNPLCNLTVIEQWPCGQNPSEMGPWLNAGHCGGVFHNTSFYGFVAGTGDYQIEFTIFACAGTGVQYGIYSECDPNAGPICDGNANTGTIVVDASQLTPCQTYVFWIDGFSGSVCSYFVHVIGDFNECQLPPIEDIVIDSDCAPLCPSITYPLRVNAIADSELSNVSGVEFHWKITTPSSSIYEFVNDQLTIDYTFAEAGTYEICISSYHPCPGLSTPLCREFEFIPLEDDYMEFKICTADFPFVGAFDEFGEEIFDKHDNPWGWIGGPITLAMVRSGNFQFTSPMVNKCGCSYEQTVRIQEVKTGVGYQHIALCPSELPFTIADTTFNTNVDSFLISLPGVTTNNGCDTVISLTTRILNMGGQIRQSPCMEDGIELSFNMGAAFLNADRDSLKFIWHDPSGSIITDNDSDSTDVIVPVSQTGLYLLDIRVYKFGDSCTFNFTHNMTVIKPLQPEADNWQLKVCEDEGNITYGILSPDPTKQYIWSVPNTATKIQDDSTGTIIIQWNGPTGGQVCVFARDFCGDSPPECANVVFVDMTDPAFSIIEEVCKDAPITVVATSSHIAGTVYNWDFDGGTTTGPTTGPGPYSVSWNTPGQKIVTLSVNENGCISGPAMDTINVIDPPVPPIFGCTSDQTTVTFSWDDYPGALSYTVNVISAPAGHTTSQVGNSFIVGNLAVNTNVVAELVVTTPGPCPSPAPVQTDCTTQNCTPPTITFDQVASLCLVPNTPVIDLAGNITVTPNDPGTGVFTSSPVASSVTTVGIFDPNIAGVGSHKITYTYTTDLGCVAKDDITIVVKETPLATFVTDKDVSCILDPIVVTYTGGTTGATYDWDFGPYVVGTYNGPGPHSVIWDTALVHTIRLVVTKNGCPSVEVTKDITIEPELDKPVITCADQRKDGVTFGWEAVENATSYQIFINGALQGTQSTLTYDVNGLMEKETATIRVVAISDNACPDSENTKSCIATSCQPITLTIPNPNQSLCLDAAATNIPLTVNIIGNTGTGSPTQIWSGTGVNDATKIFDPRVAGVGSHEVKVVVLYDDNACADSTTMLITVKQVPTATFTSPDVICITDALTVTYNGNAATGTYSWDFGSDVIGTYTGKGPHDVVWTNPGVKDITLTVTSNGCTSTPFTKKVTVDPTLEAPIIACTNPRKDGVTFSWDPVLYANSYDILVGGVSQGVQSGTTFDINGLNQNDKVTIEVIALSNNACPDVMASQECEATDCPIPTLTLPADMTVCNYANAAKVPLTVTVTGNTGVGTPVETWSGPGVDDITKTFDPTIAGVGTHTITLVYKYDNNECETTKTFKILVRALPIAKFTAPDTICVSDPLIVTYTGTKTADLQLNWANDPAVRTDLGNDEYSFHYALPGIYTINLVIDANGCTSEPFSKDVVVTDIIPAPIITCSTTLSSVKFSWNDNSCYDEFERIVNGTNEGLSTLREYEVTGLNEGDKVTLDLKTISDCPCPVPDVSKECVAQACPPVVLNLAAAQTQICFTDNITTSIQITATVTGNTPDGKGVWSGPNIDQNGVFNPKAAGLGIHQFTYTYTDSDCEFSETTSINVTPVPEITWEIENPACYNLTTGSFIYSVDNGTGPYTTKVDNITVNNGNASGILIGQHQVVVTDANGCVVTDNFEITAANQPTADISGPVIVQLGSSTTHTLVLNGINLQVVDSISWLQNGVRVCASDVKCLQLDQTPVLGEYVIDVTIYYNSGCSITTQHKFIVSDKYTIDFPTIFYPESKSGNSSFHISTGDPSLWVKKMRIYDRWGNLVFEASEFSGYIDPVAWNGTYAGKNVEQGVYVYVFDLSTEDNPSFIKSGDITLIR
ncbi:MAG: gliding motility-associated C-terminal domain-containing protein [Saprospiraceae bacterium]